MAMSEDKLLPYLDIMKRYAQHESQAARKKWGLIVSVERHEQSIQDSKLGGKAIIIDSTADLSPVAKLVLNYLENGLTHSEIAKLMGTTRQAVGDTMRRYGITRKQLSKFRKRPVDL